MHVWLLVQKNKYMMFAQKKLSFEGVFTVTMSIYLRSL